MNSKNDLALAGKVAVITGAASGIGLALTLHAARCGMKVAMVDVEAGALDRAVAQVKSITPHVMGVITDVSSSTAMQALATQVESTFGPPWLVVNNAGVAKLGLGWQLTDADWRWVIDVNLYGVVNGVCAFLPGLVQRNEGYLINTASAAGLIGVPGGAPYVASKHAVVGLSESLYRELRAAGSPVGISVLCPAAVMTNIVFAERNRPGQPHFDAPEGMPLPPLDEPVNVLEPSAVAEQVFSALHQHRFWILPHADQIGSAVLQRAQQIVAEKNPDAASMDRISALLHGLVTGMNFTGDSA